MLFINQDHKDRRKWLITKKVLTVWQHEVSWNMWAAELYIYSVMLPYYIWDFMTDFVLKMQTLSELTQKQETDC